MTDEPVLFVGVGSATQSQRDAYKQAREWMDTSIAAIRPGVGSDQIARLLPKATDFGFENEMAAFGLQFAHGLGLRPASPGAERPHL